jgi:hypothetical protein
MKNQSKTSKLAAFANKSIDKKQMKQVQGGWSFWDWCCGGGGAGGGRA